MNDSEVRVFITGFNGLLLVVLGIFGILIDGFCSIFFFNEFRNPKSPLRSPYFIMLAPGLFITVFALLTRLIFPTEQISSEVNWETIFVCIVEWFSQNALGIWIFFLGLNRCTAIMSPRIHAKVG